MKKRGKIIKNKNQKVFSLKQEYKESWNYLKESKKFIYSIIILFFVFSLIGFFIPAPDYISKQILETIEKLIEETKGLSGIELIWFILKNNSLTSFYGLIFGVFIGIVPVVVALSNGYLLGFVSFLVVENTNAFELLRLLPHGVFELPAVFISLGLGLKLGTFIFQKNKFRFFRENLIKSLKVFLYVIIPLLIIAAVIEGSLMVLFSG